MSDETPTQGCSNCSPPHLQPHLYTLCLKCVCKANATPSTSQSNNDFEDSSIRQRSTRQRYKSEKQQEQEYFDYHRSQGDRL